MANTITLIRFPLLIGLILLLYSSDPTARLIAVPLLIILILLDSLDGIIARARDEVSPLGAVLDIMADRSVELVLWVCFAHIGLIPVVIPIIYILRGVVVDALRSAHMTDGKAPFDTMTTKTGRWLVASPAMRSSYGIVKAISFAGLALTNALAAYVAQGQVTMNLYNTSWTVFRLTSWLAVALCLARGLPVIVEALSVLEESPENR